MLDKEPDIIYAVWLLSAAITERTVVRSSFYCLSLSLHFAPRRFPFKFISRQLEGNPRFNGQHAEGRARPPSARILPFRFGGSVAGENDPLQQVTRALCTCPTFSRRFGARFRGVLPRLLQWEQTTHVYSAIQKWPSLWLTLIKPPERASSPCTKKIIYLSDTIPLRQRKNGCSRIVFGSL